MLSSHYWAKSTALLAGLAGLAATAPAVAIGYGIYDARSLAMGGATVAAANSESAHFYNPALLSFENEDEDDSKNGRFIFPTVVAFGSDAGEAAADVVRDNLDQQISDSVAQFNTQTGDPAAAAGVLNALNKFDEAINDLNQQSIEFDAYVGLSVSEPADREGGSFYFGVRGLVFGSADISAADLTTMDTYVSALEQIAAGTATVDSFNGSIAAGGQLIDPRPNLTSQAELSSLAIGEWGIALSKEFAVLGQAIAFGVTPKIMQVEVYREEIRFSDQSPSYSKNKQTHLTMNLDVGIAAQIFDDFRVGLAVRDLLPKSFSSQNNLQVELNPRTRLGAAYVNKFITVGLDVDLQKNEPVATEPASQEAALGFELRPWEPLHFRFGYRQDMVGERDDILSAGLRYQIWRFVAEAGIAKSDEVTGGSLQLGWTF